MTLNHNQQPIDFQSQGLNVKVTPYTLLLNHLNTIQTEPYQLGLLLNRVNTIQTEPFQLGLSKFMVHIYKFWQDDNTDCFQC